jgi:hypothetical protein
MGPKTENKTVSTWVGNGPARTTSSNNNVLISLRFTLQHVFLCTASEQVRDGVLTLHSTVCTVQGFMVHAQNRTASAPEDPAGEKYDAFTHRKA